MEAVKRSPQTVVGHFDDFLSIVRAKLKLPIMVSLSNQAHQTIVGVGSPFDKLRANGLQDLVKLTHYRGKERLDRPGGTAYNRGVHDFFQAPSPSGRRARPGPSGPGCRGLRAVAEEDRKLRTPPAQGPAVFYFMAAPAPRRFKRKTL